MCDAERVTTGLAVVSSVKHFYHFLYGRYFVIRTDHSASQWLVSFKDVQGQLTRWLQNLQQYDFTIVHRAGESHANADAFLRTPCAEFECQYCVEVEDAIKSPESTSLEESHPEEESSRLATLTPQFELSNGDNIVPDTIKKLQAKYADIGPILKWLNEDTSPEWAIVAPCSEVTKFCGRSGIVYAFMAGVFIECGNILHLQLLTINCLFQGK